MGVEFKKSEEGREGGKIEKEGRRRDGLRRWEDGGMETKREGREEGPMRKEGERKMERRNE